MYEKKKQKQERVGSEGIWKDRLGVLAHEMNWYADLPFARFGWAQEPYELTSATTQHLDH